eukprot:scaffold19252_cov117-Isochrysis_galbana.AAC.9
MLLVYGCGCAERGARAQGPLPLQATGSRRGLGGPPSRAVGQYADALARKTKVCLVLVRVACGVPWKIHLLLLSIKHQAPALPIPILQARYTGASAIDRTRYAVGLPLAPMPQSPKSFM